MHGGLICSGCTGLNCHEGDFIMVCKIFCAVRKTWLLPGTLVVCSRFASGQDTTDSHGWLCRQTEKSKLNILRA